MKILILVKNCNDDYGDDDIDHTDDDDDEDDVDEDCVQDLMMSDDGDYGSSPII